MAIDAELSPPPSAGLLLDGRYRVGAVIGKGGMASVYAAEDLRLSRPVAVKLFHPTSDETVLARLTEEARLLAGLSHPGLLRVFDISTSHGQPYLVMELVDGTTLRRSIDRGPMAEDQVAKVGTCLAGALAHVHSQRIVHRDIKPSNVLLDRDGAAYLADFGIARALGAERLTAAGHCVGTAAYLAPEQVTGGDVGPAADIYALGLVLLECLTRRREYPGPEVEAAVARLHRAPRMPEGLAPTWRAALTAMTALDPRARPTAAQCTTLLTAATTGTVNLVAARRPVPALAATTTPIPHTRPRGSVAYVPASALALAAATVGGLLWLSGAQAGRPVGVPPANAGSPAPVEVTIPPAPVGSAQGNVVGSAANPVVPVADTRPAAGGSGKDTLEQGEGKADRAKTDRGKQNGRSGGKSGKR